MSNKELVRHLINNNALKTKRIINAFSKVDRAKFCLDKYKELSYTDQPLPILAGQTISQPTTVAIMTELLQPSKGDNVLEIGTGSGYQAAILAEIVNPGKVYTIETISELVEYSKNNLKGYNNIEIIQSDGSQGLAEKAPFDCIIVTACAPEIPKPLKEQLKYGGRMVIPVGKKKYSQNLLLVLKKDKFEINNIGLFAFVPLIGEFGFK